MSAVASDVRRASDVGSESGSYRRTLARPGLQSFLWTQFLGAFNDNVCKFVVSMLAVALAGAAGAAAGVAAGGSTAAGTPPASGGGSGDLPLVGVVFILPFLLFSGYAGQVADRYNKRTVLIVTKALEIVAMALAVLALYAHSFNGMLAVLFLLALQASFFSPAKYGIVPEVLPDGELSRANGLLEMSTFAAIVLGTSLGGFLFAALKDRLPVIGLALLALAILGSVTSLGIPNGAPPADTRPMRVNPWAGLGTGLARLTGDRTLGLSVLGISYFWFLGALLQMVVILFGKETLALSDVGVGLLGTSLAVGIGTGSVAAGRLSGEKVELGLVPLGSIGMGVFSIALAFTGSSFWLAAVCLAGLGFAAGLFIVPLNALIQQRPEAREKGQVIATNNLLNTVGILLASGAVWLLHDYLAIAPARIILVFGLATLAATSYILMLLPAFFVRFTLWLVTHTLYRIRIAGHEHVPVRGPALLVCNHMSHVDGFLVGACMQRFVRFMVYRPYYDHPVLKPFMRFMHAIPVAGGTRQEMLDSIERARAELRQGHVVCIFAEGSISRTGGMLPFKRGFERIVADLDVPIVPVYLDRMWGSIFSFKQGRFFWKWPERLPYPVTVAFGAPLPATKDAAEVRQAVQALGSDVAALRFEQKDVLHRHVMQTAKRRWRRFCTADSTGKELTYGHMLIGALLLSRWIRTRCAGERMVGLVLPASVGGALANVATMLAGKVPVNVNFTAGREGMAGALAQCDITTIITSRIFLARAKIDALPGMVFIEDALKAITPAQRVRMAIVARLLPVRLLARLYAPEPARADDLATVIFSSGSTGVPKGVMLSHRNILSNIEGMAQIYWVTGEDRVLGVLPFFHSFGFTGTLWFPFVHGFGVVYHPNPMDAGPIGELVQKYRVTLMITTPTFCNAYLRKCSKEQFATLRYAVVGAEKLREPLARDFLAKFGLTLLEGYGCTEMAPVVSVNMPDAPYGQRGTKLGTVGHPLPGVVARVVDPETGVPLEPDQPGLLLVKGGNRMLGYLNRPDLDREAFRDGWYVTGDIAAIDEDGFIRITDRLSRFSKIAGEMVPHVKIEETISHVLDDQSCAVTSIPDESKGERLVAFYTKPGVTPQELWSGLAGTELPKLWIPKRENIHWLEALPLLGTGKLNLRELKRLAEATVADATASRGDAATERAGTRADDAGAAANAAGPAASNNVAAGTANPGDAAGERAGALADTDGAHGPRVVLLGDDRAAGTGADSKGAGTSHASGDTTPVPA
jgi:acyl-[acyl-carrier-protein]-phospholipid O-acyltransferase/long-chain-fatty-acid--[acyl-carrier-protein] ligase